MPAIREITLRVTVPEGITADDVVDVVSAAGWDSTVERDVLTVTGEN